MDAKIEFVALSEIVRWPRNPKTHDEPGIEKSIARFGFVNPLILDERTKQIVAGHGRLDVLVKMREAGAPPPDRIRVKKGDWLVPVIRGVRFKSDLEAEAYVIADNKLTEAGGWDDAMLGTILADLAEQDAGLEGVGLSQKEIETLMGMAGAVALDDPEDEPSSVDDELAIPEKLLAKWKVKPGQIWEVGRHRLMAGDCRNVADVERLMGGRKVNVAVTSPPYASQRKYDEGSDFVPIPPDEYVAWFSAVQKSVVAVLDVAGSFFLNIKEHCEDRQRHLYVKDLTIQMARAWGWMFVDEFCWAHGGTPKEPRGRFKNAWEPVFQFTRALEYKFRPNFVRTRSDLSKASVAWFGTGLSPSQQDGVCNQKGGEMFLARKGLRRAKDGAIRAANTSSMQGSGTGGKTVQQVVAMNHDGYAYPSNVIRAGRNRESWGHGAAFPAELPGFFIRAFSDPGDAVFDPFGGSYSTVVAAEKLDRDGFAMDISPKYVAVGLERLSKLGLEAKLMRKR